jgi:Leucine-rich repeat (LRR) protein/uncharacterized membrane protein
MAAQAGYLHVLDIQLNNFTLAGSVPSSIANMTQLQVLNLSDNHLTGSIPDTVGQLKHLLRLNVGRNELNGTIPSSIGQLASLTELSLDFNYLTGSIPDALRQLKRLELVRLGKNGLNGTIPSFFGDLTELRQLFLRGNQLSGSIPEALGQLVVLTKLDLTSNNLTGSLPDALAKLTQLERFAAGDNLLTGTIPKLFGNLTRLLSLGLSTNRLTGTIPDIFAHLPHLVNLPLFSNRFRGTIPASLGNLTELVELSLCDNQLTGLIPRSLEQLRQLRTFYVDNNLLSGPIPDIFHPLLTYAAFQYNSLTGTLPASALNGSDPHLVRLMCNNNQLSGTLPDNVTSRRALLQVNLGSNSFSGSLPSSFIESLQTIQLLSLCNNTLTGTIPPNWTAAAPTLTYLYMHDNSFSGPIPESLGNAPLLQILNLSSNRLVGSVPPSLQHLSSLTLLMLQYNTLTGNVANVFDPARQANLSTVQLSNNKLTGALPAAAFLLPSLNSFAAVDNCFDGPLPLAAICSSTGLSALVLDGFHSAKSCRNSKLLSRKAFKLGPLPRCLLSIPKLSTLHLSNSGLTGSLPADANISAVLTDLALSHNLLTGEIPPSILGRDWDKLYLSYNRFTGTLRNARGAPYTNVTDMHLRQNRLSGVIPASMQHVGSLSLVENNMFSCRMDRSDLPRQDTDRSTYTCGSDAVNSALYTWGGVALLVTAGFGIAVRQHGYRWAVARRDEQLKRLHDMFRAAQSMVWIGMIGAAYSTLVLLPVYMGVNFSYPSFTYKYAWAASGVFLTGSIPFVLEATFLLLLLSVSAYVAERLFARFETRHREPTTESTTDQSTSTRPRAFGAVAVMLLSLVVVAAINGGFVVATLQLHGKRLIFVQVLLAVFKLGFNNIMVPALQGRVKMMGWGHKTTVTQLGLVLVNLIAIPCLVVLCVSPACYYNAFRRPAAVPSSYVYSGDCLSLRVFPDADTGTHTLICGGVQTAVDTTTYNPPFTYSYQCSSSFITSYAPTFVIMCIISGFVVPAYHLSLFLLRRSLSPASHLNSVVTVATPHILQDLRGPQTLDQATRDPLFDASQLVTSLLTYLALLFTSGALFPPLAVCCAVAMASVVLTARLKVGRYVSAAVAAGRQDCLDEVESACADVATPQQLRVATYLVLAASCVFYTLFLFDTLGYEVGFAGAFWVLIVVPLLPLLVLIVYTVVVRLRDRVSLAESKPAATHDVIGVAMSDMQSTDVKRTVTEGASEDKSELVNSFNTSPMHASQA